MRIFRLFVDKYSSGYQDLFLKIDVSPSSIDIADSYYLYDFFEIDDEEFSHLELKQNQKTPYIAFNYSNFGNKKLRI